MAVSAFPATDSDLKPLVDQFRLPEITSAIGIIMVGEPGRLRAMGTGFLVSPCHVLTAAHTLAEGSNQVRTNTPVRFVPTKGAISEELSERAIWGRAAAFDPAFSAARTAGRFDSSNAARDWVLVELERAINDITPLKLQYPGHSIAPGATVSTLGYGARTNMSFLTVHDNCTIRPDFHRAGEYPIILFADCAVRSGMSGGPLLVTERDQAYAAGVVIERIEINKKIITVAVSTRAFADAVVAAMRASQVCAVGAPFAAPPP